MKGHVIPIPPDPELGKMDKNTLTFPRHLIVEKMLLSPRSIINSVKYMLQNSVSATRRCSKIESLVVKGF